MGGQRGQILPLSNIIKAIGLTLLMANSTFRITWFILLLTSHYFRCYAVTSNVPRSFPLSPGIPMKIVASQETIGICLGF